MADFGISEIIAITAIAVSAAAAGTSTALTMSAQSSQAHAQEKAAQQQADAEKVAGAARRKQVEYDAAQKKKSMYSRQAASGALIGQGSLLEGEMAFASEAEYAAQLAEYPHVLAGAKYDYDAKLFGAGAPSTGASALKTGVAFGGSLASGYSGISGLRFNKTPAVGYDPGNANLLN